MSDTEVAKSVSERTGSFAAGGYVHLGPSPNASSLKSDPNKSLTGSMEKFVRSPEGISLPPSESQNSSSNVPSSEASSQSQYPKTKRFEHVETDQGT